LYLDFIFKLFNFHVRNQILRRKLKLGFYVLLKLDCHFTDERVEEGTQVYINSLSHRRNEVFISKLSDIREVLKKVTSETLMRILDFSSGPSGIVFSRVDSAFLEIYYYDKPLIKTEPTPLESGEGWRELPEWIRNSKSIVNIQNKDSSCFKWCVTRHFLNEKGINYRVTNKLIEKSKDFKWFGLDNPETFNEENLCKFEDHNNVGIIIFDIDDEPGYRIMHMRRDKDKYKEKIYIGHYIDHFFIIRNLKGFIGVGVKAKLKTAHAIHVCDSCYSYFHRVDAFRNHLKACSDSPPEYRLPRDECYLAFGSYNKTLRYPAVCYADFEATTLPDDTQIPNSFAFFCPDFGIL
jgi:hypothetical protein